MGFELVKRLFIGSMILFVLALCPSVFAQTIKDRLGTHIVQPGETLGGITERYLGESFLWRENWKLNPEIDDPNRLKPGYQLVVILERTIEAEGAAVAALNNEVEKSLKRSDWIPASRGDELKQEDGLRTLERSSAELKFNDNSTLLLSEYSQIFLENREVDLRGVDRGRIALERGRAELSFQPIVRRQRTDIELVAGSAVARPTVDNAGNAQMRATTDDAKVARFMVLQGESSVSAGGETVAVAAGEGTVVEKDKPPSAPEKLLSAPMALTPADGAAWLASNQVLSWEPLDGAESYLVEICADVKCAQLLQVGATETHSFAASLRQAGEFMWRVRGVSATGLEGIPSAASRFSLDSALADQSPPVVSVLVVGAARRGANNAIRIGPAAKIRLAAYDDVSGVDAIEYKASDGAWQPWRDVDLELAQLAWPLEVRATDRLGKRSASFSANLER